MTNTEPLDLDAIEARAAAATPGPWENDEFVDIDTDGTFDLAHVTAPDPTDFDAVLGVALGILRPDAEFIAHAREDVPALIAEVRRLRGLTIGATDDPKVDTCWAVVLDDCGSADLYETREEADAARASAPDTGLDYIVTTTVIRATLEESR